MILKQKSNFHSFKNDNVTDFLVADQMNENLYYIRSQASLSPPSLMPPWAPCLAPSYRCPPPSCHLRWPTWWAPGLPPSKLACASQPFPAPRSIGPEPSSNAPQTQWQSTHRVPHELAAALVLTYHHSWQASNLNCATPHGPPSNYI